MHCTGTAFGGPVLWIKSSWNRVQVGLVLDPHCQNKPGPLSWSIRIALPPPNRTGFQSRGFESWLMDEHPVISGLLSCFSIGFLISQDSNPLDWNPVLFGGGSAILIDQERGPDFFLQCGNIHWPLINKWTIIVSVWIIFTECIYRRSSVVSRRSSRIIGRSTSR